MTIKTLKFTSENLKRHLEAYGEGNIIFTTRDERKGQTGNIFDIAGAGYYMLTGIMTKREAASFFPSIELWWLEGFENSLDFDAELKSTYGEKTDTELFVHCLHRIPLTEINELDAVKTLCDDLTKNAKKQAEVIVVGGGEMKGAKSLTEEELRTRAWVQFPPEALLFDLLLAK